MRLRSFVLFFIWAGVILSAHAQNIIQTKTYPMNYFRYPLDLPPSTAGSFGELRPNHFHSGLDFKTNGTVGFPVHAAADGFVSRVRVQFGGFGNALYITHPNGYVTVYGHLQRFAPEIEKILKEKQYQLQSFEADIDLQPAQLKVCQGDIVAWSGNAGASEGPHLHFEIRDALTQETINPQLFGLVIKDHVPPALGTVCVYHLGEEPFSEKTSRQFFGIKGGAGHYNMIKPQVISVSGATGFGITATDMNSASFNHNGIYSIELKVDDQTVYTFAAERFAFDQTHSINAYIDYPVFLTSHRFIQKCFILPESKITLYPQSVDRGIINFTDNSTHQVSYIVKDIAGNTASLTIKVKSTQPKLLPSATKPGTAFFHYDKQNEFTSDNVKVIIPPGNLYDDLNFSYTTLPEKKGTYSEVHRIHNRMTPINDTFELWIKPDNSIGQFAGKAVIVNTEGICEGGEFDNGYVKAKVRTFGDYYLKLDTLAPTIRPINIREGAVMTKMKKLSLKIGDNLSGIKSYAGKIDNKWVLMEWDYKTHLLSYSFDQTLAPGLHHFELTVTDNKDNIAHFTANFKR